LSVPTRLARWLLTASIIALALAKAAKLDDAADAYNGTLFRYWLSVENIPQQFLGDLVLGGLVLACFVFARYARIKFSTRASSAIRYMASYSFSFYLFHIPLFTLIDGFFTVHGNSSVTVYLSVLTATTAFIIFLAHYTEHKKGVYRKAFGIAFDRLDRLYRTGAGRRVDV
jgi:hypothetical protein